MGEKGQPVPTKQFQLINVKGVRKGGEVEGVKCMVMEGDRTVRVSSQCNI